MSQCWRQITCLIKFVLRLVIHFVLRLKKILKNRANGFIINVTVKCLSASKHET